IPRDRPSVASAVLISSIDFSPRFLTSTRSVSLFCTRSATRCISALLSALIARAGSVSSSSVLPSDSRRNASLEATSASSSSSRAPRRGRGPAGEVPGGERGGGGRAVRGAPGRLPPSSPERVLGRRYFPPPATPGRGGRRGGGGRGGRPPPPPPPAPAASDPP